MMKWLRAHTKEIMVIVVLLAMFSFVGGSALVSMLAPSGEKDPALTAFGHVVTYGELNPARRDIEILDDVGIGWKYDGAGSHMLPEHWHVLGMEAARAGIAVSNAEIDESLENMGKQPGFNERLDFLRTSKHVTPPEIRRALGRHLTILKYAQHLEGESFPSEPQVRHHVRDTEEKVGVQFVNLSADKFLDESKPVSDPELQAQFEKYKDVDSETGPDGFGYKLPRRVKLEYILASAKTIEPQIQVGFEEVKNHWKTNKSKYKKVVYETPPITSMPTSGPAASQPAPVPKNVEKTFAEAKPDIEKELRRKNALIAMEQAMNKIAGALQKPWLEVKLDPETGYKPVPPVVKTPGYLNQVFEKYAKEFSIALEYHETEWLTAGQIPEKHGLGDVSLSGEGSDGMSVAELAYRIPLFYSKKDKSEDSSTALQLFQTPDSPLAPAPFQIRDQSGRPRQFTRPKDTLVIFRVVDAHDVRAPLTLDEVRAKVEKDVRRVRAMNELRSKAEQLCAAAKKDGLAVALGRFDDLKKKLEITQPSAPPSFARLARKAGFNQQDFLEGKSMMGAPDVTGLGVSEEFVNACFTMAEAKDESAASATPPTSQPAAPKVESVELKKLHSWCVFELKNVDRVDRVKYETSLREQSYAMLSAERFIYLKMNWFKPENIEKRSGYERAKASVPVSRGGLQPEYPKESHPMLDFGS